MVPPYLPPKHYLSAYIYLTFALLFCAACQPPPIPAPPQSTWGEIITITQVEQGNAPAIWADPDRLIAAWIGSDSAGVHQDMRGWADGKLSPVTVLPLPPIHPYEQTWVTGISGGLQLFWLDAAENGETQLFAALLNPQWGVERGPTPVSDALARHYAAVSDGNGQVWTAWSGGLVIEPTLYLQAVDEGGRPQLSQRLAFNADYPALARSNDGTILLFWLQDGQLMRAILANGAILEQRPLGNAVYIGTGDRLHNLSVGLDRGNAYVFWNITRATGENETWFVSSPINAAASPQPSRLGINAIPDTTFETGFNTGSTNAATSGETPLTWAVPLAGQYDALPVAVQTPSGLGIAYLQNGTVAGYQQVVPNVQLVGPPALVSDRNRDFYLSWSQPSNDGAASLLLTTTKG